MNWEGFYKLGFAVLLKPLRISAGMLQASEMVGVCNVLQTVGEPLSLSLALDIMEEVLHSGGDPRKQGRRMARDGALAALVKPCPLRRLPVQVACLPLSTALLTY